jgi:putative MATE family efflux protein
VSTAQELESNRAADDVITRGSTWAAIWHMSWPLLLNMATIAVASFFDIWVAGKLGSDAQAAVGIGGQVWFFMIILVIALSAGTTALVSRFWGAGDKEATVEAARQSIVYAFIFGAVSALAGLVACRFLLRFLGASPQVEELGWAFLKYDLAAQFPYTVLWISNAIFRAKGNARVPMAIMSLITFLVIILEVGLCLWPFQIGIAGIGIAWLVAGTIGVALSLALLRKSELGECLNFKLLLKKSADKDGLMRVLKIGVPACINDLSWVGGNFVLFLIFARTADPTSCQAAWAIGLKCEEMIAGMPVYAFSMAVATIVGQNLGAKQPERAETAGWQVAGIGAAMNALVGLILFFAASPIAHLMSENPKVIAYSIQYFQVVGICEPFVAAWLILFGAMQGAGYTRWPMYATVICLTGIRLPLAYYLTVVAGMGPIGTWISLSATAIIIGVLAIWRFSTGVWKHQKI